MAPSITLPYFKSLINWEYINTFTKRDIAAVHNKIIIYL